MTATVPKNTRKRKKTEKTCQYPGCDEIFYGICVTKFCKEHSKNKYRVRYREITNPFVLNKKYKHKDIHSKLVTWVCELEGCDCKYEVRVYSNESVYPKYCPEHRNEFKRNLHLKSIGREDIIKQLELDNKPTLRKQKKNSPCISVSWKWSKAKWINISRKPKTFSIR